MTTPAEVRIAGVPWPTYKLVALVMGLLSLVLIGVITASASAAVLTGAAVTTVFWTALGIFSD